MQKRPLKVNIDFYNLVNQAQIGTDSINFNNISIPSERTLTVNDYREDGSGQLTTINLKTFEIGKRANKAEGVLPHPTKNWTAVRAKTPNNPSTNTIILYNMDNKSKLCISVIPETIKFWTWVNDSLIGVVGSTSVYHLNVSKASGGEMLEPEKLHSREQALTGNSGPVQIINYSVDPGNKFAFIAGLTKGNSGIEGRIQLTSLSLGKSQFFEGYNAAFGKTKVHNQIHNSCLFAYTEKTGLNGKLTIAEISSPPEGFKKFKKVIDMNYPDGSANDFPINLSIQEDLGLLFLFTKHGLLFLFEISEGSLLLRSKLSDSQLLTGTAMREAKGCMIVSKAGNIIRIEVDESALVDFVSSSPHITNNSNVSQKLRIKAGLPGSESYYTEQFSRAFLAGNYEEATNVVIGSPGSVLRNKETIDKFRGLPKDQSGPHPVLKYFTRLLEAGKLNEIESREICTLVLQQNKPQLVGKWLNEDKLYTSEALGDVIRPYDKTIAEKVYVACNSKKAMELKLERGEIDSAIGMANPEELLNQLKTMVRNDPQSALSFAKALTKSGKISFSAAAEVFLNANAINELTSYALDYMPNNPDNSNWQTLILELNLKSNPSVAETILQTGKFTNFNKQRIAPLCEQKGLYLRALENYQDIKDIKRILMNNSMMVPPEYLKNFLVNTLPAEHIPAVLSDIIKFNRNMKLAVEVAQATYTKVGIKDLVDIFEGANAYDAIFYFLGPLLDQTKDAKVYHKYLQACVRCNQLGELEKVIQNCEGYYDAEKVLELLLNSKLADPKALIVLCDKNNYIKEMTRYLWDNNFNTYIEIYVIRVNPQNSGLVLGCLMDLGAEENYIRQLLNTIGNNCQVDELVREFGQRNRLRLLETWLEQRASEGNNAVEVHNALAKLAIDFDKNPEKLLAENRFYDVKEIGKYAETRDPHLAYTAYKRDVGTCDEEIIELTDKNNLYRLQAYYLVERQNKDLWGRVLDEENPHRQAVVEQIVSTALPDSKNVEEVSIAVQAFISAKMPEELLGLLEKIVLHSYEFSGYKKLQNLLIITAIKTDSTRVMDYINRLDNYDGPEIARVALQEDYKLYEEALIIYKKINEPVNAVNVLLDNIQSLERAAEFADKINLPEVWTVLGQAYLKREMFSESIDCFIKANNGDHYEELIELNKKVEDYDKLLVFFDMARKKKKEMSIDNEYIFALAKLNRLTNIESFIKSSNSADLARTGNRLYSDKLYEAAKILYIKLKSNSKIASCLVHLGQYQQAIDFAQKANNVKTWKEIVFACVEEKEFKLAAIAGTQVVLIPDHLEEMVKFYELHNASDEIIKLLEQTITNEKSHIGIFTELAALYAKYKEDKLFDFIKAYFQKLNVSKLIRVCKKYQLWREIVYLHSNYKEYDAAVKVMIEHSPSCFSHETFVNNLLKVAHSELIYKAIAFYIEEEPLKLNELLRQMTLKVDFSKVVEQIKRTGYLALIVDWLKSVQNQNNQSVNDALNQIYLEMEDYDALRNSILNYDSIDAIGLAKQIEGSDNPEFRRISALIYRKNKKYKESIEISIGDENFRDAIETAQESNDKVIIDQLILYFAQNQMKEFFAVTSYTCYEYLSPDYVLELSWRYGFQDFAMPFMIQIVKEFSSQMESVQKKHDEREKKETEKQERDAKRPLDIGIMGVSPNTTMGSLGQPGVPMLMNNPSTQGNYNAFNQGGGGFGNNQGGGFGNNTGGFSQNQNNPNSRFPPF